MKKLLYLLLTMAFSAVLLCGCGEKEAPAPTSVEINGTEYEFTTEYLDLTGIDCIDGFISNAGLLDSVKKISLGETALSADRIEALKDAYPNAAVEYMVNILGTSYPQDTQELDLRNLQHSQVEETAAALSRLPELKTVTLVDRGRTDEYDPNEDGVVDYVRYHGDVSDLPFEDYVLLKEAAPQADIEYCFELFDLKVNTVITEKLQYKNKSIGDSGLDEFRKVLPYLDKLSYVSLDRCGTSDEETEKLNEEFPDKKIVWRIYFGPYTCMTDAETLWAMCIYDGQDNPIDSLKYCHELKNLDIGHSEVMDLSFLYGTPQLEVLIMSCGNYGSFEPVGSLKNLTYLEAGQSQNNYPKDISPLANCKNLEYLHLGLMSGLTDLSAIKELTNLKRLNLTQTYFTEEFLAQVDELRELLPNTDIEALQDLDSLLYGHWRFSDGGYTPMYQHIRDIFCYDDIYGQPKLYGEFDFEFED